MGTTQRPADAPVAHPAEGEVREMEKIVANVFFSIGLLCIYVVLWFQYRRGLQIMKDVEIIKKTACNALLDCDKQKSRCDKLSGRIDELKSDLEGFRNARLVAHWEEGGKRD